MKSERAQAILKVAIESGEVGAGDLTIVIVVDKTATVDMASCAPSHRAANMIGEALLLALSQVDGHDAELKAKIDVGQS